uniref:Uncharacterized protein n=1 Tax=Cucumis melo TaxID=3656 RepID=A0A9I9D576_CUCME
MGKDIRILITDKHPFEHTKESQSNNGDRHWKRCKRPDKQSIDDEEPPIEFSLGDRVLYIGETSKSIANPKGCDATLNYSENFKTPISATTVSTRPLVIKEFLKRVKGMKSIVAFEISHFCADNLISDLRRQTAITLWENLQQKIMCTRFEKVNILKPEMYKIFDAIATSGSNNLTFLKELMDGYFQTVKNHNQMHSTIILQSTKDTQLTKAKGFMKTLQLDENHLLKETSSFQYRLTRLSTKEVKLEAKLKAVRIESNELSGLISKNDRKMKQKQHDILKTYEKIDKLEYAPIVDDANAKLLPALCESLKNTLEELKHLKWTP